MAAGAARVKNGPGGLRRALGFRDLLLFYIATTFSLRWMATAAASGPSALVIWILGAAGLFVPLVFATLELSSRFPEEGGLYVWARETFGPFAGFMAGWLYWCSNLPYFPSLLYFAAGNLLYVGGDAWQALTGNSVYFMAVALAGLGLTLAFNLAGLDLGKWLSNVGGLASWIVASVLIVLGGIAWTRFGSAQPFTADSFIPRVGVREMIFWSTIAFAFGGVESASTMAGEIRDARRTVPRAVTAAAAIITLLYLAGTAAILVAVPREQVSGIQGIMQAVLVVTSRVGAAWVAPVLAALVVVTALGGIFGWFAAVARLPLVAGLDRFLPAAFGRVDPRTGTPRAALIVQGLVSAVFVVLGQAGTSVRGAYEVLVSLSIITTFIPFLFIFAALVRVQRSPAPAGVVRVPGGPAAARVVGAIGFVTTSASIVLACIPAPGEPDVWFAVAKVVGASAAIVGVGIVVYANGRRRSGGSAAELS